MSLYYRRLPLYINFTFNKEKLSFKCPWETSGQNNILAPDENKNSHKEHPRRIKQAHILLQRTDISFQVVCIFFLPRLIQWKGPGLDYHMTHVFCACCLSASSNRSPRRVGTLLHLLQYSQDLKQCLGHSRFSIYICITAGWME